LGGEIVAKLRRRDADEGARTLRDIQAVQVDAAVLGDHPVNVGARGGDRRSRFERRHDPRETVVSRRC
jgi:hypothetical protein